MSKLFINNQEASIDLAKYTLFHGNSVFTTLRSRNLEPLLWRAHWGRLSHQAAYFSYAIPEEEAIFRLLTETLKKEVCDQKIRIILGPRDFALTLEAYSPPDSSIYLGVSTIYSNEKLHPEYKKFKTGNSLPYQRAHAEALSHGVFESLLLDAFGNIVDGSRTSIMHFDGETLIGLEGGLSGIMREEALSYAKSKNIKIAMKTLGPHELTGQLLLANCLLGVVPVGAIKHDFTQTLVDRFRMDVRLP